jgi:hypothetical protein
MLVKVVSCARLGGNSRVLACGRAKTFEVVGDSGKPAAHQRFGECFAPEQDFLCASHVFDVVIYMCLIGRVGLGNRAVCQKHSEELKILAEGVDGLGQAVSRNFKVIDEGLGNHKVVFLYLGRLAKKQSIWLATSITRKSYYLLS